MGKKTGKAVAGFDESIFDDLGLNKEKEGAFHYLYPRVTIVIPTYNCDQAIGVTLDSVINQSYPELEIIVVDASSTDHTLSIIKSYRERISRIYSVTTYQQYEMLNRGISLSTGTYICFLFPGDFYISKDTIIHMMQLALDNDTPDLVYCGALLRYRSDEPLILSRPFTMEYLKKGMQPTTLQSCCFLVDSLVSLRKFDPSYSLRGGFDLLCRFRLRGDLKACVTSRVLTDFDRREMNHKLIVAHFTETLQVLYEHFGFMTMFFWLFRQQDIKRMIRLWFRGLRSAFFGRN
ncbi:MAG: glycosyltransferase [Waddliaceae bacterium]|nr:glycosyltransferase [Waddliaceae bacterium]